MDLLMLLAILGGIYVILAFWHFPADWLFQSQKEALTKATNHWVRARHCLVYTALYVPLLLVLRLRMGIFGDLHLADMGNFWWCLGILWLSHFIIDTYWPVMMWAKYLRRADQFKHVKRYGPRADGSYTMTAQQFRQFMEHGTVGRTRSSTRSLTPTTRRPSRLSSTPASGRSFASPWTSCFTSPFCGPSPGSSPTE